MSAPNVLRILSLFLIASFAVALPTVVNVDLGETNYADGSKWPPHRQPILTVHIVPHSHDDVGWLKTIDEYYDEDVRPIYENLLRCLSADNRRKFIIVEQAFFSRWFTVDASDDQRALVRQLLASGQLEFVNGGWVMNDEACTTAEAIVDQLSAGWQFINRTFGPAALPRYAYQIDPFGHSATYASIAAQMGYEALILNRIHFEEKQMRKQAGQMQFHWQVGKQRIFAHLLDRHYSSPPGLDFEVDPPLQNRTDIAARAARFVAELKTMRRNWYPSQLHFLQLAGDDFRWRNAAAQYNNWEQLIDYINRRSWLFGVRLQYSTLSDYFDALHGSGERLEWGVYADRDFFPYADYADTYWTGYFTSKPFLKQATSELEAAKWSAERAAIGCVLQGSVCVDQSPVELSEMLSLLKEIRLASAELQHHDGVTGTSTERVTDMYMEHIAAGKQAADTIVSSVLQAKLKGAQWLDLTSLNSLLVGERLLLVLYNPLDIAIDMIYQIQLPGPDFAIQLTADDYEDEVDYEIVPSIEHQGEWRLVMRLKMQSSGQQQYHLIRSTASSAKMFSYYSVETKSTDPPAIGIRNDYVAVQMKRVNNDSWQFELSTIVEDGSWKTLLLNPWLQNYQSHTEPGNPSGAYIMRAVSNVAQPTAAGGVDSIKIMEGRLVREILVRYQSNGYSQLFRLSNLGLSLTADSYQETGLEIVSILPEDIPVDTEHIIRFHAVDTEDSDSSGTLTFFTDANGLRLMERQCRPNESPAVNFYPSLNTLMKPVNSQRSLMVLTDRSLAAGSQSPKSVELMFARRTSRDDWRGVGEPLNDRRAVRVSTMVYHDGSEQLVENRLDWARQIRNPPVMKLFNGSRDSRDKFKDQQLTADDLPSINGWRLFSAQLLEVDENIRVLVRYQVVSASEPGRLDSSVIQKWLMDRFTRRKMTLLGVERVNLAGISPFSNYSPLINFQHSPSTTEDDYRTGGDIVKDNYAPLADTWQIHAFIINLSFV